MNEKKWYENSGREEDVVVSTQIYLSRNIEGYSFVRKLRTAERKELLQAFLVVLQSERLPLNEMFSFFSLESLDKPQMISLVERGLATPDYISRTGGRGIFASKDEALSIVVNGEDHVTIHSNQAGLELERAYDEADRLERLLSKAFSFSYDDRFGYLTQNPANLGTGMHASLILHLPALSRSGALPRVASGFSKLGIDLRECMEPEGRAALYCMSNRVSLGISEQEALFNLKSMSFQLISQERAARQAFCSQAETEDLIFRAEGILSSARILSQNECMELLSLLRLGVSQGFYRRFGYDSIAKWMAETQPATLSIKLKEEEKKLEKYRAAYMRSALKTVNE